MVGVRCFVTFMCGGEQIYGGVIIVQVYVYVTVISFSWSQFFQLIKKFIGVSLLSRGGGYFLGHDNGINGR